jgi:hypothetical protein
VEISHSAHNCERSYPGYINALDIMQKSTVREPRFRLHVTEDEAKPTD